MTYVSGRFQAGEGGVTTRKNRQHRLPIGRISSLWKSNVSTKLRGRAHESPLVLRRLDHLIVRYDLHKQNASGCTESRLRDTYNKNKQHLNHCNPPRLSLLLIQGLFGMMPRCWWRRGCAEACGCAVIVWYDMVFLRQHLIDGTPPIRSLAFGSLGTG